MLTVLSILALTCYGQDENSIPEPIMDDWISMTRDGGNWITESITDAQGKKIENEQYGMKYTWGLGEKSVEATLYVVRDGKNAGTLFSFKFFYHPYEKKFLHHQYGSDGTLGIGETTILSDHTSENIASIYLPNGQVIKVKHVQETKGDLKYQKTFLLDKSNNWYQDRSYVWKRTDLK